MRTNTNQNQNEKEKKEMELWTKILIGIAGVGCVGLISFGIYNLQTAKENEIIDASQASTIITVQDNIPTETLVDKTIQYQEEAETYWRAYGDKLVCTQQQFISEYINYRNNGLTEKQAFNSLYNKYAKEFQTQVNEKGEAVAQESELDAVIRSQDENITEEVTEPSVEATVVDFEVQPLESTTLYTTQTVNLREGPSTEFNKTGSLDARQQVTVIGIVKEYKGETVLWYLLDDNTTYVSGAYLVEKLPAEPAQQQQPSQGNSGNNQNTPTTNSNGQLEFGGFVFPEGSTTSGLTQEQPGSHEAGSLAGAPTLQ